MAKELLSIPAYILKNALRSGSGNLPLRPSSTKPLLSKERIASRPLRIPRVVAIIDSVYLVEIRFGKDCTRSGPEMGRGETFLGVERKLAAFSHQGFDHPLLFK